MKAEQLAKYPDYLMEFDYIAALAGWQKSVMSSIASNENILINQLKMEMLASNSGWNTFLKEHISVGKEDALKQLHQRYTLTTEEVFKKYILTWMEAYQFVLEYDKENFTFKMTVLKSDYNSNVKKWTRDILPCNMLLEVETVTSLG